MIKVLLTAIGCPGGMTIIESLRSDSNIYIIGTDVRNEMASKYCVNEFYQVPKGKDDNYIPFMLDLCKKIKPDVILPLATFELLKLSENKDLFDCKICVSDYESLYVANNKMLLYEKFNNVSPKFKKFNNDNDLIIILKELNFPSEKVVIKPPISHGSIGLRIIDNDLDLYDMFLNSKPNNINIPYYIAEKTFTNKTLDLIATEYLPGKEYGVDLLVHPNTNKIVSYIVRDNGDVFHSEISNGRIIEDEKLLDISKNIINELKLSYTINIDFKEDKHGEPKILEINPRLPATSYLAYSAGLNLPLYSIYLALGIDFNIEINKNKRIFSYRNFKIID